MTRFIFLIALSICISSCKTTNKSKEVHHTEKIKANHQPKDSITFLISDFHSFSEELYREDKKSFYDFGVPIDRYFIEKKLKIALYNLPNDLINKEKSNQKIRKWSIEDHTKDKENNILEITEYDDKGRMTSYINSSCVVCADLFPWGYKFTYDENNRIIEQKEFHYNETSIFKDGKFIYDYQISKQIGQLNLSYNADGNIHKVEKYYLGKLQKVVKLIEE